MSEFYNTEHLSERLAAVCKERDELRQIVVKQADMNRRATELALELDEVKAERDALQKELHETKSELVHCRNCKHRRTDECPRYRVEIVTWQNDELMPEWDEIEHDSTKDDGFCDRGERDG